MAEFGAIDIWVNVAVRYHHLGIMDIDEEDWDALTDINLKGYWLACKAIAPIMVGRKKGSIINMTSQAGLRVFKNMTLGNYAVTKAGVVMLTKQLALNLAEHNVRVNAIALSQVKPDPMPTEEKALRRMNAFLDHSAAAMPLGRNAEPSEIANGALFLASDASSFVTGHVLVIDGGNII
jgi:NAD(P)-dependent dehydrogenase (short-subunit alcohol dehydrogenase family)